MVHEAGFKNEGVGEVEKKLETMQLDELRSHGIGRKHLEVILRLF